MSENYKTCFQFLFVDTFKLSAVTTKLMASIKNSIETCTRVRQYSMENSWMLSLHQNPACPKPLKTAISIDFPRRSSSNLLQIQCWCPKGRWRSKNSQMQKKIVPGKHFFVPYTKILNVRVKQNWCLNLNYFDFETQISLQL